MLCQPGGDQALRCELQSAMVAVHPRTNTEINKARKNVKNVFCRHQYWIMKLAEGFPTGVNLVTEVIRNKSIISRRTQLHATREYT